MNVLIDVLMFSFLTKTINNHFPLFQINNVKKNNVLFTRQCYLNSLFFILFIKKGR